MDIDIIYEKIKKDVTKGLTIIKSLKNNNIESRTFYKNLSEEQKRELKVLKILNAKHHKKEHFRLEF